MSERTLITGGNGFLGSYVARALLDRVDELGALLEEVGHERPVVDRLRPHAPVAHGAHRVGGGAQRVGAAVRHDGLAAAVRGSACGVFR